MDTIAHPRFGRVRSAKLQSNSAKAGSPDTTSGVRANRRRNNVNRHPARRSEKGMVSTIYLSPRRIELAVERGAVNGRESVDANSPHDKPDMERPVSMLDELDLLWKRSARNKLFHGSDADKWRSLLAIARLQAIALSKLEPRRNLAPELVSKLGVAPKRTKVFLLLAEGKTVKAIAGLMGVSYKTVEYHWAEIKTRLQIDSYQQATILAIKSGMLAL